MSDIRTLTPSRRTVARLGVAGAAALASTFTLAPAALADETHPDVAEPTARTPLQALLGIGTGGEDGSGGNETDETGEPTTGPTAGPSESAPARDGKVEAAKEVEPNFGLQKVRVGVKIADGSVVPSGTTTLGTTIRITETGPNAPAEGRITECTTTLESADPSDPTATFCEFDNPDPFDDDIYISANGSAVKIKQLTVNENLIIDTNQPSAGPCTPTSESEPFCDETTLLLVDRVRSNDNGSDSDDDDDEESDDEESDDEESDEDETAELPDAGGTDRRLLGYGLALMYGGGVLLLGARLGRGRYVRFD